jgi:hypothetical protein
LGFIPFLINTFDLILHPLAPTLTAEIDLVYRFLMGLLVAPLTLVIAGLCIRRAPANLIGWMLVTFSYGVSVQVMRADLLPLVWEITLANLFIGLFWFSFLLIPLYFPDGQLYPARANHWGNRFITFYLFFSILVSSLFAPRNTWGIGENQVSVPNPLFIFEWDYRVVTMPMIFIFLFAGILTVIFRYRGSRELERLQLRWLLFGVLFQLGFVFLTSWLPEVPANIANWAGSLYGLIIPTAVGIAILRYRLYDIDLIIRRTLQYGLLTVMIGLIYFGMVILLEQSFRSVTGQESPLAVVLSTLAIAVLFNPLRRRIQGLIDRRFFRARYDADQAVASFTSATRGQLELNELANRLAATAQESLQPEGVWVWIRKDMKPEH